MNMKGRRATRSGQGSVYKEEKISDESDTSSESEFEPSDDEQSSASSNESSDQSDNGDNFNPFGGSDSDDGNSAAQSLCPQSCVTAIPFITRHYVLQILG